MRLVECLLQVIDWVFEPCSSSWDDLSPKKWRSFSSSVGGDIVGRLPRGGRGNHAMPAAPTCAHIQVQ